MKNGDNVGCQEGSFIYGILRQLGFQDDKLRIYNSVEELDELLRNGTENGGISAAFDETPYMKCFLVMYCSKYTIVEPTFKADGFAFVSSIVSLSLFVFLGFSPLISTCFLMWDFFSPLGYLQLFQKGSLLTRDVSTAITKVHEGDQMKAIEEKWFKKKASCSSNPNTVGSSDTLSLDSFWGLFIIAGVSSSLAVFIFVAMFLYENSQTLTRLDSEASFWTRIREILRVYDQKDRTYHTYNNSKLQDSVCGIAAVESSPNTSCPPRSSSSSSDCSEPHIVNQELVGIPNSTEQGGVLSPNGQATQDSAHE